MLAPPGQAPCECAWPLLTMPCLTIQSLRLFSLPPPIWVREGHAEGGGEARPLVYWQPPPALACCCLKSLYMYVCVYICMYVCVCVYTPMFV